MTPFGPPRPVALTVQKNGRRRTVAKVVGWQGRLILARNIREGDGMASVSLPKLALLLAKVWQLPCFVVRAEDSRRAWSLPIGDLEKVGVWGADGEFHVVLSCFRPLGGWPGWDYAEELLALDALQLPLPGFGEP